MLTKKKLKFGHCQKEKEVLRESVLLRGAKDLQSDADLQSVADHQSADALLTTTGEEAEPHLDTIEGAGLHLAIGPQEDQDLIQEIDTEGGHHQGEAQGTEADQAVSPCLLLARKQTLTKHSQLLQVVTKLSLYHTLLSEGKEAVEVASFLRKRGDD